MATELELKFYANDDLHRAVMQAISAPAKTIRMQTTYFDTPSRALSARKITLRKRLENGEAVCTVKTPLPGHQRGEWETPAQEIESAVPLLIRLGAPGELTEWTAEGLIPVCGARFTRQALYLEENTFTAEIALDKGVLTGGGKELPLCEIELEYKSGNVEDFLAYGKAFAALYHLTECKKSKFRRAFQLYTGE